MELKLDVKTLVVGIALGVILAATLGASGSADETDFGIAVPRGGFAVVKTGNGAFYLIDVEKGGAVRIADETRGSKSKYFDFDMSSK